MKLLILCTVLSVLLAVSWASPVKTEIRDENDISESSESLELNKFEKNSSSAEEENATQIKQVQDNNEKDVSFESSEKELEKYTILQEEISDSNSSEEEGEQRFGKSKRSVDITPHSNNQISVKDSIIKRLRRAEESDESASFQKLAPHLLLRNERSADDTSEENSSEEKPSVKDVVIAKKTDTAPAETLELAAKPDAAPADSEPHQKDSRRKRNTGSTETSEENSSEEDRHSKGHAAPEESLDAAPADTLELATKPDTALAENQPNPGDSRRKRSPSTSEEQSSEEDEQHKKPNKARVVDIRRKRNLEAYNKEDVLQEQEVNEVFIFSSEKFNDSVENFDALTNNENVSLDEKVENKNSEEDYAQGCGGSSDSDNSNENSDENNETLTDKL